MNLRVAGLLFELSEVGVVLGQLIDRPVVKVVDAAVPEIPGDKSVVASEDAGEGRAHSFKGRVLLGDLPDGGLRLFEGVPQNGLQLVGRNLLLERLAERRLDVPEHRLTRDLAARHAAHSIRNPEKKRVRGGVEM